MLRGDCLEILPTLPSASVDMVLADPPYGVTRNTWDCQIDLQRLWPELLRVTKPASAIVMCAAPPFDKQLAVSNLPMYRYDWVWEKGNATGHLNAKKQPLRAHEYLLVFYREPPTYNPQKTTGHAPVNSFYTRHSGLNYGHADAHTTGKNLPLKIHHRRCLLGAAFPKLSLSAKGGEMLCIHSGSY